MISVPLLPMISEPIPTNRNLLKNPIRESLFLKLQIEFGPITQTALRSSADLEV